MDYADMYYMYKRLIAELNYRTDKLKCESLVRKSFPGRKSMKYGMRVRCYFYRIFKLIGRSA